MRLQSHFIPSHKGKCKVAPVPKHRVVKACRGAEVYLTKLFQLHGLKDVEGAVDKVLS
jgi:hypothetical protein